MNRKPQYAHERTKAAVEETREREVAESRTAQCRSTTVARMNVKINDVGHAADVHHACNKTRMHDDPECRCVCGVKWRTPVSHGGKVGA